MSESVTNKLWFIRCYNMFKRVQVGIIRVKYSLRKVLPVIGIVVNVQNVANFGRDGYKVSEGRSSGGVDFELLQKGFAIREGVKGDRDSGANTPGVEMAERNGVSLFGSWLGLNASSVEFIQEELVDGYQKEGELARHECTEG